MGGFPQGTRESSLVRGADGSTIGVTGGPANGNYTETTRAPYDDVRVSYADQTEHSRDSSAKFSPDLRLPREMYRKPTFDLDGKGGFSV